MGSCSSTLYLITHMGGALSSIPLCSRARQPAEADIGEADLNLRPGPVNQETICTQPQVVEKTQTQDSETCINNENHGADVEKPVAVDDCENQVVAEIDSVDAESDHDEPDDDCHEEVSLEDDVEKDNAKEDSKEENEANDESKEENVSETFRKPSPELDTAAAITNTLSEIVGDNKDSSCCGTITLRLRNNQLPIN